MEKIKIELEKCNVNIIKNATDNLGTKIENVKVFTNIIFYCEPHNLTCLCVNVFLF